MNNLYKSFEENVLRHCQKPARYIGNEINAIRKDWKNVSIKWGLFFPDLYELGSSNLGVYILYSILNRRDDTLAERFFMPAIDAIKLMEEKAIPPLSLENKMPAIAFDVIGITLPYELTVTNILKFLKMSKIPYRSSDRDGFPLIIGGGTLAFNPLPLVPFFDAFVVGDGEDAVLQITEIIKHCHKDKMLTLHELSKLPYVFVPLINKKEHVIKRAIVSDLNGVDAGTPIVPLVDTTFNRLSIEAARGCTRGCRFCFAGMTQRPYRERNIDTLANIFMSGLITTGFDEFSPASLSITDYSDFSSLFHCLHNISETFKASLSLPSLRVGSIKQDLAEKISSFRKTGLTVAPETYPSFQTSLNKNINYDDLKNDIETAFQMGWLNIKLYYMIGLPDEEEKGLYEIKDFAKSILSQSKNRANITLSFSTFVPKPHTPLQWCRMNTLQEIQEKQKVLKSLFYKEKKIFLRLHNPFMSILEGLISRGNERVADVIERAFEKGALFDAWDEHLNFTHWQEALNELNININDYLKGYDLEETLPWQFIDTGIKRAFLVSEYNNYFDKKKTPDCRFDKCSNCGVCDFKNLKNIFTSKKKSIELTTIPTTDEKKRYLIVYEKCSDMRYLGMLDMMRLWHRILRILQVPLIYTRGFNPQPVIDGGWALPLGMESLCEIITLDAESFNLSDFNERFKNLHLNGLNITYLAETHYKQSVDKFAKLFEFKLNFITSFDNTEQIVVKRKGVDKIFNAAEYVKNFATRENATFFTIEQKEGGLKPLEFASYIAKRDVSPFELIKTKVWLSEGEIFGA